MKILILTSNPRKDLNLNEEIRDLKGVIERSRDREQFEVEVDLAVRPRDLQGLLLKHEPHIVHFCGHGTGEQGLVLQDDFGQGRLVSTDALKNLFELFSEKVECVLLNACYSETQAVAIVEHINYVIGMSQAIRDDAAIAFATGFYGALGYGRPIEQSFKFGCNQIHLTISDSGNSARRSISEEQRKLEVVNALGRDVGQDNIPEYLKPKLKQKSNLTTVSHSVSVRSSEQLSSDENVEIQLTIDRTYDKEIKLKQYRDRARVYLDDRRLSPLETIRLERLRKDLGLSEEETKRIVAEEQEPIRKAQEDYEEMLLQLIEKGYYPFNAEISDELRAHCQEMRLTDSEVETISKPILEAAEEEYQQRLATERQQREEEERKQRQKAQELKRELQQQRELERQRQVEERRRQEEAKRNPPLQAFEFQIATVNIVEKFGLLGTKTACDISYRQGRVEYFVEDLNGIPLEMVAIPGGSFTMGSTEDDYEKPPHSVKIQPFYMGKFAVTQAQWSAIAALPKINHDLNSDPANFKGKNRPVEQISWFEALEFCARISQETRKSYRLPTEAEWEYACRAGTNTPFHTGETITTDLANYDGNYTYGAGKKGEYRRQTTDVGSFPPNAFGLYDTHGNVWEWCADPWHEDYIDVPTNGSIWEERGNKGFRLLRGGSWYNYPSNCRSALRYRDIPHRHNNNIGFRALCSLPRAF